MGTKEEMVTKEVGTKEVKEAKVKEAKVEGKGNKRKKQKKKRRKLPQLLVSKGMARSSIASSVGALTIFQKSVKRPVHSAVPLIQRLQAMSGKLVLSGGKPIQCQ